MNVQSSLIEFFDVFYMHVLIFSFCVNIVDNCRVTAASSVTRYVLNDPNECSDVCIHRNALNINRFLVYYF